MADLKLNEQLLFLRKQKQITQEELAQILGVTNQSVSKWENGTCCPDISLLPDIAKIFSVSVDELLGYKPADTLSDVYLKIRSLFEEAPAEESFDIAFKLAALLHEGASTRGYKGYIPWKIKDRSNDESYYNWGFSACSEPEGTTIMYQNSVFISAWKEIGNINNSDLRSIYNAMEVFCDKDILKVMYALFELTTKDYNLFVNLDDIVQKSELPVNIMKKALNELPIQKKQLDDGAEGYRLEGSFMHIPPLLMLFARK